MRVPQRPDSSDLGVNMTPMIDVVFLLIIFFLLSNHMARREARMPLPLPEVSRASADLAQHEGPLTVQVDAAGQWLVGGSVVDRSRLETLLAERLLERGPELPLRIRCDRTVTYERVEPILRMAAQRGIADVALAVYGAR
jgi:biopolymer transport protein ExbD